MAVYKLFPYKDTTLYSQYPQMNTGIDPILQVSNLNFAMNTSPQVARALVKFVDSEINDVITNLVNGASWDAYFKLFIATAQGIVEDSTLEVWPAAVSSTPSIGWNNGTGTYLDQPLTTDGACWESPFFAGGNSWPINTITYVTGSWNPQYSAIGGGAWYTSSANPTPTTLPVTQSFDVRTEKDLNVKVTDIVKDWRANWIPNQGFLLKWEDSAEFNPNKLVQPVLQYYSVDTNTIYPPQLEIRWDDFVWSTGSSGIEVLNQPNLKISLAENPGTFFPESVNRFRLNVTQMYPPVVWSTSSLYTIQHYLPSGSSYYAVKDLDTNEYVIEFSQYTKISADASSSYFDIYMNGLEPERYYKILVQVTAGGSTTVYDDKYYFKVING
jgi:hypothetical protein